MSLLKSELTCSICKLLLKDAVTLPCCFSSICGGHMRDDTIKEGTIRCLKCEKEFELPQKGFEINGIVNNILAKELYLSDTEKTIKHEIGELIQQMEHLQTNVFQKQNTMEVTSYIHFAEICRQIDMQREELKKKIDEIALKLIDQVKETEKAYNIKLMQTTTSILTADIHQMSQRVSNEFRSPNLTIAYAKRIRNEHEHKLKEFQAKLNEINSLDMEIKLHGFKNAPSQIFREASSFGSFISNNLIAISSDDKIKIWNFASDKYVTTLEGHAGVVFCFETIDDDRFATGSGDNTIKIWDTQTFACLNKIITCHKFGAQCLKSLSSNRLASGESQIKIWSIEKGECMLTLNPHAQVYDLVCSPNGHLVSCSEDKTIQVWDLNRGECLNILKGHSKRVVCLVVLKNSQLASCSHDTTIKLWNMDSGECARTLQGHSNRINRLLELESGELVSCSWDNTIKIWNVDQGKCIQTLKGHSGCVESISVDKQNRNTLFSCSDDNIIKTWNMSTGECITTIEMGVKLDSVYFKPILFMSTRLS